MTEFKSLFTAQETAAMLGMSVSSVWRRVNDGSLSEPIRIGGATRWVRDELIEVISAAQAKRRTNVGG
jgi:predicted DNA-binding transcriptional regulator AlpA